MLLTGGQRALGELIPEIEEDLKGAGAVTNRIAVDIGYERPGYDPYPKRDLGFDLLCMSRPLLEFVIRERIGQQRNIGFCPKSRVTELLASPDGAAVVGVRFENADGRLETIASDIVVDASGRAAPTLAFLAAVGAAKPEETEIGMDQAYSTAVFDIPEDASPEWMGLLHLPSAPDSSRAAFIIPIEHRRWIVSLGGNHGDPPPGDAEGFMEFARSLRTTTVYEAIRNAKRVCDIARFNLPCSVRRHFEKLDSFPRGLIPLGDSICRFNPVFGQGMSVAAQEAAVLRRLMGERAGLPDPQAGLALAFFAEIQFLLEAPWATAMMDFVYPKTRGDRPADFMSRIQYGAALLRLAAEDPEVHKTFAEVNSLIRPQSALREPRLAARVREIMMASA